MIATTLDSLKHSHFLKMGFENNEVVMLVTEEMTKGEARDRMQKEWDIDVKALETA